MNHTREEMHRVIPRGGNYKEQQQQDHNGPQWHRSNFPVARVCPWIVQQKRNGPKNSLRHRNRVKGQVVAHNTSSPTNS